MQPFNKYYAPDWTPEKVIMLTTMLIKENSAFAITKSKINVLVGFDQ